VIKCDATFWFALWERSSLQHLIKMMSVAQNKHAPRHSNAKHNRLPRVNMTKSFTKRTLRTARTLFAVSILQQNPDISG
jgi:hypothetical protein